MSARTARKIRVSLRLTAAEFEALRVRADAAGLPVRTFMQRILGEASGECANPREILREVRALKLLNQKLWLSAAQGDAGRAEVMRIVASVEASS